MDKTPHQTRYGFRALLVTQFLGAFNDNVIKFVIAMIAVDSLLGKSEAEKFLALIGGVFIIPFLLFSTYAGYLADRFSKQKILVVVKAAEILIMTLGLLAFLSSKMYSLLIILFLMGIHSAFFSPAKYGILPEILEEKRLSEGNGLLQMWTYTAIIMGQVVSGPLIHFTKPHYYKIAFFCIGVASLGFLTSLWVTKVKPAGSKRSLEWNFLRELFSNIIWIKKDRPIFLSIVGLMYFGFLGGLFQLNILLYAKKMMALGEIAMSVLTTILSLGIGVGGVLAGKLSDKKIEFGLVPLGAMGLTCFSFLLGFVYHSFIGVAMCLFVLGISSGFYIIPLNSYIQQQSPSDRRGQVIATNNFLSFVAILLGSGSIYLLGDLLHLNPAKIFMVVGLVTLLGTSYICSLLPYSLVRFLIWILTHTIYKIKVVGSENIPPKTGALLVSNHVAYIDALLILVSIQRPIRFVIHRDIFNIKILNPLFRLAKVIPIAGNDNPKVVIKSLNTAKEALRSGELVCIFAEGHLTRTGNMLQFKKGLEVIMKDVDSPIIPVHLDRVWGSIFSFERGKYFFKFPKLIPYPVTVTFGTAIPSASSAFEIRNRVMELGSEAFSHRLGDRLTLSQAFFKETRGHPFKFCIADSTGKKLNYAQTLILSVALAFKIKKEIQNEENIGVLLPPSVAGVLANLSFCILDKIPVNLNYTSSQEALVSVIHQCQMKTVLTSKIFLEKLKISLPCRCILMEDLVRELAVKDKITAVFLSLTYPSLLVYRLIFGKRRRNTEDLATIMFTSGSTGDPKGVMLTHANITSNLEGLYQVFHVKDKDCILGVLPFFHSFGFTATLWFPLLSGIGAVYHTNPLDARTIGQLTEKYRATILMSTPTFLNAYINRCTSEQFKSLRLVVVGAEKLKENVARSFKEKFGIVPMEGYGCTELSPIVSINLPDFTKKGEIQKAYKPGKIGLPIPGVAVKVLDQETLNLIGPGENGLLFVKGPNIMKGYLNRPQETAKVIMDGWYKTGDIANLDEDGFIEITDRLSRFSKIAGEMVPHIKLEEKILEILNTSEPVCVVTSLPDEKRGEKLMVLCLKDIDVVSLVEELKRSDLPNLWIPETNNFLKIDSIPLLGTGKLDLGKIKRIAQEAFSLKQGTFEK